MADAGQQSENTGCNLGRTSKNLGTSQLFYATPDANQLVLGSKSIKCECFFNTSTKWTQCKIVNAELGKSDCCSNGSSTGCNKPWYLEGL